MARGRLEPPNLDDRTWTDIVEECKTLIPKYAPEWTDHNPSDLGIALVELFAWLVEGMIYRLNRVPEKNFVEFLNLLGISRDPATPASAFLTYAAAIAGVVPKGSQAATPQTDEDQPLVFETNSDLTVLPTNLTTALHIRKVLFLDKYRNVTTQLVDSPLQGVQVTVPVADDITLVFGFDQPTPSPIQLLFRFAHPARGGDLQLTWRYSRGLGAPSTWPLVPGVVDETQAWQKNGRVEFTVPLDWASQNPTVNWAAIPPDSLADKIDQARFWIAVRAVNLVAQPVSPAFACVLFNAVEATNALTVPPPGAFLGVSTGQPFQTFELRHAPLYKKPGVPDPYEHLTIEVRDPLLGGGFGPWVAWTRIDYLPAGAGTFFRLDPVTATVSLGNHDTATPAGHGTIPPPGAEIRALTYRYVAGGANGNVGPGAITVLRTPPPAGIVGVRNRGPGIGGSNEEDIDETKRRGPEVLRNRYRAVTAEDYEYLAREATTDVRKVRALAPRLFTIYDTLPPGTVVGDPWTYGALNRDAGNASVVVIPAAPLTDGAPMPSLEMRREVSDYLAARRVVTAALHVVEPRYLPIRATVAINVWRKAVDAGLVPDPLISNQYRDSVIARISEFFHPILGRGDSAGWEVGQDATISELFEFIKPSSEIGFIASLSLQAMPPLYTPSDRPIPLGGASVWIQLADYEIVCSHTTHLVTVTKV